MARYMFIVRYASDGAKGVVKAGGTARRAAIDTMATQLGGHLETFDFAFGEDDVYSIVELPDNKAAAAYALAVNSTGLANVRTVVLVTPEEIDAAAQQKVNYSPPSREWERRYNA
ncbi:MAG TPA: GYD domain-containing protein [Dermatophilaceae bacterium]